MLSALTILDLKLFWNDVHWSRLAGNATIVLSLTFFGIINLPKISHKTLDNGSKIHGNY